MNGRIHLPNYAHDSHSHMFKRFDAFVIKAPDRTIDHIVQNIHTENNEFKFETAIERENEIVKRKHFLN